MKKVHLFLVATAVVFFAGCSPKQIDEVKVDEGIITTGPQTDIIIEDTVTLSDLDIAKQIENEAKSIYFDFDSFGIKPSMQQDMSNNANLFNSPKAMNFNVKVEGNADEWGTDEYNYALSLKRAKSVKDSLIQKGIDPKRIAVVSYGEANPVCTEKTKSCWSMNRRVDFKVFP